MNTKIALSGLSILASLTLMGGATFAFFSNSGTSTGNSFSTGTIDLKLSDSAVNGGLAETDQDSTTVSFGASGLAPNSCTGNQTLILKNTGSITANHVDITANNSNGTLAPFLRINNLSYGGNPVIVADSNANLFPDLQDLATSGLVNLAGLSAGGSANLVMDVCLDQTAGNTLQGVTNTLDLTILLDQGPHI